MMPHRLADPGHPANTLLPTWGHYAAVRPLGEGSTGRVWLARDQVLDRLVAVKVLSPEAARALGGDAAARREGRLLSRLSHPNVVAVYQLGTSSDNRWLAMEYVSGGDLGARLQAGEGPDAEAALRLIRGIGEALDHAHSLGVIHRDIKPQNILLAAIKGDPWWPKVADFGLARATQELARSSIGPGAAGLVGTPLYMAPEVASGRSAEVSADVYGLALLAWQLWAGRHPFGGAGGMQALLHQMKTAIPPLSSVWPQGAPLDAVLNQALAKDPEARPKSASVFLQMLDQAWQGPTWAPPHASPPTRANNRRVGHQAAVVLSAEVALAARDGSPLYRGAHAEALEYLLRRVARAIEEAGGRAEAYVERELLAIFPGDDASAVERAIQAALEVREILASAAGDPTLEGGIRVVASVGVDVGSLLSADWLGGGLTFEGDALAGARSTRGRAEWPTVRASGRALRLVRAIFRCSAPEGAAEVLSRQPAELRSSNDGLLPFVGRESEVAQIGAAAASAEETNAAHVLLLLGEGGMGKTRLLDEALPRLAPALVLRGRCPAAGTAGPFAGLSEALAPLWDREIAGIAGRSPTAGLARRLLVDSDNADGGGPAHPRDQQAAFAAVTELVAEALAERAVVLVLDDAGAAPAATLELLAHMISALQDQPLLVVMAGRSAEQEPDRFGALTQAVPVDHLRVIRLRGLSQTCVAALTQSALEQPPNEHHVEALYHASGGHPLLIEELVDQMARGGEPPDTALPRLLDAMVLRRVDSLEPREAEVVLRHAVCGEVGWANLVAPDGGPPDLWRKLRSSGLVVETRDARAPGQATRFRHAVVREVIYRNLPPRWRRDEHARTAVWLEENGAPATLVAHHALAGSDAPRAARSCLRAGLAAQRAHAPQEAREWLRKAVAQTERAESMPAAERATVVRQSLLAGALTCALTGEPQEAGAWLERAENHPLAQWEGELASHRARVLLRRAELAELQGDFDKALEALEAAEQAGTQERLEAGARRAMVLARRGRLAEAEPVARATIALVQSGPREGNQDWHRAAGTAWAALGHVTCRTGRLEEGRHAYERSCEHWTATGWKAGAAAAQLNLGLAAWWAQERAEARRRWELSAAEFAEAGGLHGLAAALTNLGELELADGRADVAVERLDEAERLLRALGTRDVLPETLRLQAEAALRLGDAARAIQLATAAATMAHNTGNAGFEASAAITLASAFAAAGEKADQRTALERALIALQSSAQPARVREVTAMLAEIGEP